MVDMIHELSIFAWLGIGAYAWFETVKEFGFEASDLLMLPIGMLLGPVALLANRRS